AGADRAGRVRPVRDAAGGPEPAGGDGEGQPQPGRRHARPRSGRGGVAHAPGARDDARALTVRGGETSPATRGSSRLEPKTWSDRGEAGEELPHHPSSAPPRPVMAANRTPTDFVGGHIQTRKRSR